MKAESFAKALLVAIVAVGGLNVSPAAAQDLPDAVSSAPQSDSGGDRAATITAHGALVATYCSGCHNERTRAGNLALDSLDLTRVTDHPETWEKVVRKLRTGLMPPLGRPRPDAVAYEGFRTWLEAELDRAAAQHPDPGRTEVFHRLNRVEYRNAIRDLLSLDVDIVGLLPPDDSSYGFDNIAGVLKVSPALLERYLVAAKRVSRLALGSPLPTPDRTIYRAAPDAGQIDRGDGLPFGTRGGMLVRHLFVQDGEYDLTIDLDGARAFGEPDQLEIAIEGQRIKVVPIVPDTGPTPYARLTDQLSMRVPVKAGPRSVAVSFYKRPVYLVEEVREPFPNPRVNANGMNATPRGGSMPYVASVTIVGPYHGQGPGDTPSRRRIFRCRPASVADEADCAKTILSTLGRRAYRGHLQEADLQVLLDFYTQGRTPAGSFDAGIELALRRLLVDPKFLFRVEPDPPPVGSEQPAESPAYELGDLELASRLSFFLWSSIPDDELLDAAERGALSTPASLERQVTRMLADPRSAALTENFAAQWLLLRSLDGFRPADPYSRAFNDTLRQNLRRETELFFESIVRENRSVLDLLTANYTFLNERLADHYRLPNVQGPHFRRVELPVDSPRRGLLGHGSILTLTSYATRTSPVIRGKFILNNILGAPPPDPPPNVPAFPEEMTQAKVQTVRERMAQHRANPACSACHNMIDPAGFALENFDAIGRWRTVDDSFNPIDTSGVLPDGTTFQSLVEFRNALVRRPERFVTTVTEKLLTYALGRGLAHYDMPAVRKIVRDAAADEYKMQRVIMGIVNSYPFRWRRSTPAPVLSAAR